MRRCCRGVDVRLQAVERRDRRDHRARPGRGAVDADRPRRERRAGLRRDPRLSCSARTCTSPGIRWRHPTARRSLVPAACQSRPVRRCRSVPARSPTSMRWAPRGSARSSPAPTCCSRASSRAPPSPAPASPAEIAARVDAPTLVLTLGADGVIVDGEHVPAVTAPRRRSDGCGRRVLRGVPRALDAGRGCRRRRARGRRGRRARGRGVRRRASPAG